MKKSKSLIEKKFNAYQDSLVLQQSDLSLESISAMVRSGAIDISPKYQRRERWTEKKESDLIESFILNIPVPPIYLAEDKYGKYSVIDGKQRITAINNFLSEKFKLGELEKFSELNDLSFNQLPDSIQNALKIRPYLRVVTLLKQSHTELKYEVFLRLNKAGVALNPQEIRNVAFRGDLNDLLFELSSLPYFVKIFGNNVKSKVYKEMIDIQFCLRFFTVREYWDDFGGNMDLAMDDFMKLYFECSKKDVLEFKKIFERSLHACEVIWGDKAFQKPNSSRRVLQGMYEIQMVCISFLSDDQLKKVIAKKSKVRVLLESEINKNIEFADALTQFTSNPKNMKLRISTFLEILKGIK